MAGVDLYVASVEILSTNASPIDGLKIVDPSPIPIRVSIRNRGDAVSQPAYAELQYGRPWAGGLAPDADPDTLPVPALAPGETFVHEMGLRTYEAVDRPRNPAQGEFGFVRATILLSDADTANNAHDSQMVHLRVAVLEAALEVAGTDINVNESYSARLTIRNSSSHGPAPAATVGFMLFNPSADYSSPIGFGVHDIPAIDPQSIYEADLVIKVPPESAWQHSAQHVRIWITVAPLGTVRSNLTSARGLHAPGPEVIVHPDYQSCAPPRLKADSVIVSRLVCRNPFAFYLFELVAATDRWYAIEQERNPGVTVYSPVGERLGDWSPGQWIRFTSPGSYFIADAELEREPAPSKFIILRELPLDATPEHQEVLR